MYSIAAIKKTEDQNLIDVKKQSDFREMKILLPQPYLSKSVQGSPKRVGVSWSTETFAQRGNCRL